MDALIHTSICIDIPLEISLCRRLIRNITYDYVKEAAETRLDHVLAYLKSYHDGEGIAIQFMYEALKEDSGLLLDGRKPKELLVRTWVCRRYHRAPALSSQRYREEIGTSIVARG